VGVLVVLDLQYIVLVFAACHSSLVCVYTDMDEWCEEGDKIGYYFPKAIPRMNSCVDRTAVISSLWCSDIKSDSVFDAKLLLLQINGEVLLRLVILRAGRLALSFDHTTHGLTNVVLIVYIISLDYCASA
jgi:hypothetical protein